MGSAASSGLPFFFKKLLLVWGYMEYKVIGNKEIENALSTIGRDIKKSSLLSGNWSEPYALAIMVMDNVKPDAEVHESKRDLWYVVSGKGIFILGGTLVDRKDKGEGELTGSSIEGGEIFEVGGGDVIDIPAGVAHQIDARGERLEMLIVKISK